MKIFYVSLLLFFTLIWGNRAEAQSLSLSDSSLVFVKVEKMPVFPGGNDSLVQFIKNNFQYPAIEFQNKYEYCILTFVVGPSGYLRDVEILKKIHPLIDQEAVRVVQRMPRWTPGFQNSKPVSVKFTIPLRLQVPKVSAATDPKG
jgi:hypothetical protein